MRASFVTIKLDSTVQRDLGMILGVKKLLCSRLFASPQFDRAVTRALLWLRRRGGIDQEFVWEVEPLLDGGGIYSMLLEVSQS